MSRTTYFTATSLDGFIADPDHSLDWLLTRETDHEGPLGYTPFFARCGSMVMGASTYQWVLDHLAAEAAEGEGDGEPAWPYEIPCWVCTHRTGLPVLGGDVRFHQGDVAALHPELVEAAEGRDVWVVGGGDLAGQFADHGLLDELIVAIAPVTLGAGAPLLPRRLELRQEEWVRNGELGCARFSVVGPRPSAGS